MSMEAKIAFTNRIKGKLRDNLTILQKEQVIRAVSECLIGFDLELDSIEYRSSDELLRLYLNALEIQGRSQGTLGRYEYTIKKMINSVKVSTQEITVFDLRNYLTSEKERGLSNETLEGERQVFSAYFNWLFREGLISNNPIANLGPIKRMKKILRTYSEIDIEKLKQQCNSIRDKALVCFMDSTACRISEITQLNRVDVNINQMECKVLGKGNKERTVYFDAVTGLILEQYLKERVDNNEALFVSKKAPYERLKPGAIREMLHKLQINADLDHIVHPHKFRRTRATRLVKHGMPIQEVAAILGHEKLDTTMKYVVIDNNDIKNSYQRYV